MPIAPLGGTGRVPGTACFSRRETLGGPVRLRSVGGRRHTGHVRGNHQPSPRQPQGSPFPARTNGEGDSSAPALRSTGRDFPSRLIPKAAVGAGRAAAERWAPLPCPGRQQHCDTAPASPAAPVLPASAAHARLPLRSAAATCCQREPRGATRGGGAEWLPSPAPPPPARRDEGSLPARGVSGGRRKVIPSGEMLGLSPGQREGGGSPTPTDGHPGTCLRPARPPSPPKAPPHPGDLGTLPPRRPPPTGSAAPATASPRSHPTPPGRSRTWVWCGGRRTPCSGAAPAARAAAGRTTPPTASRSLRRSVHRSPSWWDNSATNNHRN